MSEQMFCPGFIRDMLIQSALRRDEVCVIDGKERTTTWGGLMEQVQRTASYIRGQGVGKKSFIVVYLPNCMEFLAAELATWLCGCTIVPVSNIYPQARVDYIVKHCEAALVIDEHTLDAISDCEPLDVCDPEDDIAAIFYTSGSTGAPKGVIHTFESLSHIDQFDEILELGPNDCYGLCSPMSFIASMFIIPPLRHGGRVYMIDRETITDARLLQEAFTRHRVTTATIVMSLLRQLDLTDNTYLRCIITGSERVSNLAPQSDYRLINTYGMTETLAMSTYFEIRQPYDNTPIGKPYNNIELRLADDGEICLRGPLSPGYYKDAEKSAQLWRGGWFHTGDLARMLPDGNLEYVSRKDWMCKINGQRVETGEVTHAMTLFDGVKNAATKAFTAENGQQYLVGYFVADEQVDEDRLRQHLAKSLPVYMIPTHFLRMTALPLTITGKVDMNSLQSPVTRGLSADRVVAKPENALQGQICSAFETALGVSPLGIDDDFFLMGGDSIRVMKLQNLCAGIMLTARMVYRYKTPRLLAEAIAQQAGTNTSATTGELTEAPLSKTQEGIFVECMKRKGQKAYNNPILYRLGKEIDVPRLAKALEQAVSVHPGLFTEISVDSDGMPRQRLSAQRGVSVPQEEMSDLDFMAIRDTLEQPFDVLHDRLFRIRIIQTPTAKWLFTDFHHIVYDGSSNKIFLDDVERAYRGENVEPEETDSLRVAADEAEAHRSGFLDECREWYVNEFQEVEQTSLPESDRNDTSVTFGRIETTTGISGDQLGKAASALGVTENVMAVTAFGLMLGACTHAKESAFATIYNGRKELCTHRTMAMMVKTLPVWMKWNGDTRVGHMLQQVKTQLTGAMAHDLFSFGEVCAQTAMDSRVIFTYQDEMLEQPTLCGARCEMTSLLENATGEPMAVQLYKHQGMLQVRTEYRSNMFSHELMETLATCFVNVLRTLMRLGKDDKVAMARLVDEHQEAMLVAEGRGEPLEVKTDATMVTLFKENVMADGGSTAVVDEHGRVNYDELDRMSDIVAHELCARGVVNDSFVGLMLPRTRWFPVAFMGVFKSGGAYVPMDCEYPIDRLQYMLDDSEAKVLVTTHDIFEEKQREGDFTVEHVLFIDDIDFSISVRPIDLSRPEALAYMIYTSGTTGRPKGVMIEHHAVANMVAWDGKLKQLQRGTRVAEHASFSFDASVIDLMPALAHGAELHILSEAIRKEPEMLYRYLTDNKIHGTTMATQLGMMLLSSYHLPLRYMMMGGEKLSGTYDSNVMVINGYGPTEFTVCSSYYVVDPKHTPDNIPIGRPVANTWSAVIDPLGRLLPQGMAGEVALIGPQISRGYWHRDDTTRERFVDCPFMQGQKMYRTGDLARWSDDGNLLFMGRIDTQVKLRGFRIELGEVESLMARHEGVMTAVAAVKEIAGVQHLCGYYCANEDVDETALRSFLAASLTDYMVPTALVRVDAMPMTPNGKVDVKKLPTPQVKAEEMEKPEGMTEQTLFDIVAGTLKTTDFGVTTNLISMGMTSIGAIGLAVKIEKQAGWMIPSAKLLEMPTIRQWARLIDKDDNGTTDDGTTDETDAHSEAYPTRGYYPMTENQLGIYLDWEQHRDSLQYNIPILLKMEGVDAGQVKQAVEQFVAAHHYLTVRLEMNNGQVMQRRTDLDASATDLGVADAVTLTESPDTTFFQKLIRPFDLLGEPLYRLSVYQAGHTCWLLADVHHIIFDGGSESILMHDILEALKGKQIEPEKFTAYDYALLYSQWKESDEYAQAESYFDNLLEGTTVASPSSMDDVHDTGAGVLTIDVEREAITRFCRKAGVTENAFFMTAVMQALHRLTCENALSVVTVSNGRSMSALSHAVGMYVQTLPVVSRQTDKTVVATVQAMHHQIVDTLSRDKYPFTRIVERHGLKPQIMVVYQGDVLGENPKLNGRQVEMSYLASDVAKFPISISITPRHQATELLIEYDRNYRSPHDVEVLASAVKAMAENMADAANDTRMATVPCVSAAETAALVTMGSGQQMEVKTDATMVTLFKENVMADGGSTAVVDEHGHVSYDEIDRMSGIVACELCARGVRADSFVGLMLPRTRWFPVAFMGVFKSGGAYVPMDCEYPIDRLQYMLDDSEAKVLITTHDIFEEKQREGDFTVEHVLFIDDIDFSISVKPIDRSRPEALAYMIYTSGTTGRPKGVMIEHRAVANMVTWDGALKQLRRGTRVAEHASFSFDASVIDLMPALAHGAELHIIPEAMRKDPEAIYRYLSDNSIECMTTSTQLGMMLLSSYHLPLRYMMMGGEKLSGTYDSNVVVVNGYGPTEFTVCSSYYVVDPKHTPDNIPIGRAVPNTLSAIVDASGNLVPKGIAGEVVLVGPQLARGYWHRDDTTRERFVDCPFVKGQKMYRTGDLARWSDDGNLLFMGRIDTQVKLRGFRIELGEVESAVKRFEGVTGAVAIVKEMAGAQHLCAYFTASTKIDEHALRQHLSSFLTGYMVPDALTQLDAMPLTPNGKIDTKQLPEPQLASATVDVFEAVEGEMETLIADAFAKVLGCNEKIGRNSSFFLLGGTSLMVMKLIMKLADGGVRVTYGDVFKYPTPRTLAAFLDGYRTGCESVATTMQPAADVATATAKESRQKGADGYDYANINEQLKANTVDALDNLDSLRDHKLGDVLLLGATGYLGIHILHRLVEIGTGKVYCLVRQKKKVTCEGRLKALLMYYFDQTYANLIGSRIVVMEGDMTDDNVLDQLRKVKVDTVINCAANVKHFAAGDAIEKINLQGAERLIDYCLHTGARLVHTSTHSISGSFASGAPYVMGENELYFGQELMTKYQQSKFMAERAILEAVGNGLRAKIMRLGNLMPRYSDGEFQINVENNGFMARMRAYSLIGCIPSSHLHTPIEMAPIDETADAVLTLACTPDRYTVFHPFNNHTIYIDDIIHIMRKCGLSIRLVDDQTFQTRLDETLRNEQLNPYVTTLLAYSAHNNYVVNQPSQHFTMNVLNAMNWRWSITGDRYLMDMIEKMNSMLYFDK